MHWNLVVAPALVPLGIWGVGALWRFRRKRQAREEIRTALHEKGYEVVQMEHRYWRTGPFSTWATTSHNFVFRILVRTSGGVQHVVWARWGRSWFGHPDKLDLSSEGETGP